MVLFLSSALSSPALVSLSKTKFNFSSQLPKRVQYGRRFRVKALFLNPLEDPIVKEALKEPVAFMGGMFAGLLRLDLNEEPLKEWVTRTVEASDITVEEIDAQGTNPEEEESPQQIEIE